VAVNADVTATFSTAVTGVNTTTFALRPTSAPTSTPITASVSQIGTTNQWMLNPTPNLSVNTGYTVTLTGGASAIRTTAGTPLVTTTWSFTTGGADTTAPTVTARVPTAGATGISRTAPVTATFSEDVQGVSGATARLTNAASGAGINATVTYNAVTRVVTLAPTVGNLSTPWPANTQLRVTLTGNAAAIRDTANNPLVTTNWTFTTGP
jgi:hypothetical protein